MFKKIVLIAATTVASVSAMDNQQYGHNINEITVSTMKDTLKIPIDHDTTVLGVKQNVQDQYGIAPDRQKLYATWKSWPLTLTGWTPDRSASLLNDCNVKEVIALYKTHTFLVSFHLPNNQQTTHNQ